MIPLAVGRTAVAMRGLPDSGLMVRMTRGRAWIAVLSVLLTGIVALNVVNLSLGASEGRIAQQIQNLEQENSAMQARLALRLSNGRVQSAATSLGMATPAAGDITYRNASGDAVKLAAQRLAAGFGLGTSLVTTPTTTSAPTTYTATSPTASAAATTSSAPAPAPPAPTTISTAPAAPTASTATPGGVSPG